MKVKLSIIILVLLLAPIAFIYALEPLSKQGKIVETISSAEVMVEATGMYNGQGKWENQKIKDVNNNGLQGALLDARRTALYVLLYGGSDPVLRENNERINFEKQSSNFFSEEALNRYIVYEDTYLLKKIKYNSGTGLKITKNFKLNKDIITRDLVDAGIIIARSELSDILGNPVIMVIPSAGTNQNPIHLLKNDPAAKHASTVIQSFLTARKYDVVVPEQQETLDNLALAQNLIEGRESDYAYELALSIGSDIYITYNGAFENAGYGTHKYSMNVNAFETTTSRLLGSETGYSQGRKGESMVSIEEAMNDAIDKMLARITSYWKDDLSRGVQYKVLVSISPEFDEDQAEEIQFTFMDVVDKIAKTSKENIVTKQTLDYQIWCSPEEYDKSSKVYREIKNIFNDSGSDGFLRRININRKIIMLKIDYE